MTPSPTSPQRTSLESLLESLPQKGWLLHNLYQCQDHRRWEARLRARDRSDALYSYYCHGFGSTPTEALLSALEDGEARKKWRPAPQRPRPVELVTKPDVTTDDLMGGLDL